MAQGPTTIAAGDTVPLSLAITNKNVVALENATIEVDFPNGTRDATDETQNYPRYTENLGTIAPGATVLRSVKAVIFATAGSSLSLPISLSYQTTGSNATFVKKYVDRYVDAAGTISCARSWPLSSGGLPPAPNDPSAAPSSASAWAARTTAMPTPTSAPTS